MNCHIDRLMSANITAFLLQIEWNENSAIAAVLCSSNFRALQRSELQLVCA
jgi:hypothetical protein